MLSYLPLPRQRGAMMMRARQLLPTPDPSARHWAVAQATTAVFQQGSAPDGLDARTLPEDLHSLAMRRGLLLLVDTYSVDGRKKTWREQTYLAEWVSTIEVCACQRRCSMRRHTATTRQARAHVFDGRSPTELVVHPE